LDSLKGWKILETFVKTLKKNWKLLKFLKFLKFLTFLSSRHHGAHEGMPYSLPYNPFADSIGNVQGAVDSNTKKMLKLDFSTPL
jgi:hypothetical protein